LGNYIVYRCTQIQLGKYTSHKNIQLSGFSDGS